MPFPDKLMIGTLGGGTAGMVALEDLGGSNLGIRSKSVEAVPVHYSRYVKVGDGTIVGQGFKLAEWHLNGIRDFHFSAIYGTYITAQSTQVYIRTYSEDGKTFANYLAIAHRLEGPPNREHDRNVVLDFTIMFEQLILQP